MDIYDGAMRPLPAQSQANPAALKLLPGPGLAHVFHPQMHARPHCDPAATAGHGDDWIALLQPWPRHDAPA